MREHGGRDASQSSGVTNVRPARSAHAFAACTSASVARGLAPSATRGCDRVNVVIATA